MFRELVEELHPLMKEALERRPEVGLTEISCFQCFVNVLMFDMFFLLAGICYATCVCYTFLFL